MAFLYLLEIANFIVLYQRQNDIHVNFRLTNDELKKQGGLCRPA
jgi:hypothetical protein